MGQYVAGHIVKSLALYLFDTYEVNTRDSGRADEAYNVDKSSWTPKADSLLQLTKREASVSG